MRWNSVAAVAVVALSLSGGIAFSQTASGAQPAAATTGPQADEMADLISGVTATALDLQATLDSLTDLIALSGDRQRGVEALDRMLAAARDVNDRLNRDSDVWRELDALLDQWTARRDQATRLMSQNPSMAQIADLWQERIDSGMVLRRGILDQATLSNNLITSLEQRRAVILELYDLGAADMVLSNLTLLSDQLGTMNAQMQEIADRSGEVFTAGLAQN